MNLLSLEMNEPYVASKTSQHKSFQEKLFRFKIILVFLFIISLTSIGILTILLKTNSQQSNNSLKLAQELQQVKIQLVKAQKENSELSNHNEKQKLKDMETKNLTNQITILNKRLESSTFEDSFLGFKGKSILMDSDMPFINSLFPKQRIKLIPLYQASSDGDSQNEFRQYLQDVPFLLFIIETKESLKIGGFTSKICYPYRRNSGFIVEDDKEAFLFSITNKRKYPVKNKNQAIYCNEDYIMAFNKDLMIYDNCLTQSHISEFPQMYVSEERDQKYLEITNGSNNFNIKELQVYKVIISEIN